jgi:hypothetical protein
VEEQETDNISYYFNSALSKGQLRSSLQTSTVIQNCFNEISQAEIKRKTDVDSPFKLANVMGEKDQWAKVIG